MSLLPVLDSPGALELYQMYWPEGIAMVVDAVESAPFLSFDEKRGIIWT
jgi:hypothetical protein